MQQHGDAAQKHAQRAQGIGRADRQAFMQGRHVGREPAVQLAAMVLVEKGDGLIDYHVEQAPAHAHDDHVAARLQQVEAGGRGQRIQQAEGQHGRHHARRDAAPRQFRHVIDEIRDGLRKGQLRAYGEGHAQQAGGDAPAHRVQQAQAFQMGADVYLVHAARSCDGSAFNCSARASQSSSPIRPAASTVPS
ncbi:hypothetical protein D3C85_830280 [compost metagenome]